MLRLLSGARATCAHPVSREPRDTAPAPSSHDIGHRWTAHAEGVCDPAHVHPSGSHSCYRTNLFCGEDGAPDPFAYGRQTQPHRVLHIGEVRDRLKVTDAVVPLDAVDVVDLFSVSDGPRESFEDKAMYEWLLPWVWTKPREFDLLVSIRIGLLTHKTFAESKPTAILPDGGNRIPSHTPDIRYGVPATGIRQGKPAFTGDVVYGTIHGSHASPSYWDSKVRLGVGGATPRRAASIIANICPTNKTSNSILAYTLDRYTAADGPITAAATDYALAACGAN